MHVFDLQNIVGVLCLGDVFVSPMLAGTTLLWFVSSWFCRCEIWLQASFCLVYVWDVPSASTFSRFVPSNSRQILPFSGHHFCSFLINTQPSLGLHKRRYVPIFNACRRTQIRSWLFIDVRKRVHILAQLQPMQVYTQLSIRANTARIHPSFDTS